MNQDYRKFAVIDFIEDPHFRKWVYENQPAVSEFWTSFLIENPRKVHIIEEAREALLMMRNLQDRHTTPQMTERANHVRKNINKSIHYPVLRTMGIPLHTRPPKRSWQTSLLSFRTIAVAAALLITVMALAYMNLPRFTGEAPTADAQTVVHSNPKGKRSMLTLPDGTKVWLNAASQLIYTDNFQDQRKREVFLTGEAFFDVKEDKSKPFVVNTSSIAIKVLGTRFNVQSYDQNQTVSATLVEGKISLRVIDDDDPTAAAEATSLTSSQRAVFMKESGKLVLQNNIAAEEYSDWRSGKLYFYDQPIMEVLATIERWYDVNIHLENEPEYCTFSAKIDNKTLTDVLQLFKVSTGDQITYTIKDKEVFIAGKLCQ